MLRGMIRKVALAVAATAMMSLVIYAQAERVTLRSLDGGTVNLNGLRGKVVILSFGGTWVPMVSKELPALQKIADRYASRGVQVFWVSINGARPGAKNYASDADLKTFAEKHNLRVTVLRDPEQEAYRAFGLDALPTLVILDQQGNVARKHVGFGTEQGEAYGEIVRELEQLLK
jgi:peroxiredoxin